MPLEDSNFKKFLIALRKTIAISYILFLKITKSFKKNSALKKFIKKIKKSCIKTNNLLHLPLLLILTFFFKEMATGKIKWFNPKKGYGFIEQDDSDKDMFIHITALQKANISGLNEGDKIEYDVEEENGKASAVNIKQI